MVQVSKEVGSKDRRRLRFDPSCRATVIKVSDTARTCDLVFVDYGDRCVGVSFDDLRKDTSAHVERCPVFLRRCRLVGTANEVEGEAVARAADFFQDALAEEVVRATVVASVKGFIAVNVELQGGQNLAELVDQILCCEK